MKKLKKIGGSYYLPVGKKELLKKFGSADASNVVARIILKKKGKK